MSLFNKIGRARGPSGSTLDDIVAGLALVADKLDLLIAAPPPAIDLSALEDALGTRADCTTGESIIGLLCRLNDSIAGTPIDGPPSLVCEGFEGRPYARVLTWWPSTYPSSPGTTTFNNYGVLTGGSDIIPAYLTTADVETASSPLRTRQFFIPVFNLQTICISGNNGAGGGILHLLEANPATLATISYSPITTDTSAQTFTYSTVLQDDRIYSISWSGFETTDPPPFAGDIWVTAGVLG